MKKHALVLTVLLVTVAGLSAQTALDHVPGVGKAVRIVSLSFKPAGLAQIAALVEAEAARGADLICLPETWRGPDTRETLEGETVAALSRIARAHRTYVVCPLYRMDHGVRLNSSILIDRAGQVACVYDKIFPYWSELDLRPPAALPATDVAVCDTDFGKVGLAICYDAKFPEVFQRLRDKGAELVVWSSAYSGFTELQAFALLHHYYIVTSTYTGDCVVYDKTGALLLDERHPGDVSVSRFTLDMDRTIYHYNFNLEKRDKLLRERGDDVSLEVDMPREEWFVLKARRPGVSARALAREHGLEELRAYKDRSRTQLDALRGFGFADRYGGYPGKQDP